MEEQESFVSFLGEADAFYQRIGNMDDVTGLWEQFFHLSYDNLVDDEYIFGFPLEDRLLKIVYGPPFTIVFDNLLNGDLLVYVIRRPAF